ncbi:MAG: HD domain-containing protein [Deltaproteobacteria bacterium]|nr:HD domain-containing protein [Deltaproteobacteria bacterium]
MLSEKEKIDLITRISIDLNEVKDIDLLLDRILSNARRFFNADAGSIYLKEGDQLRFGNTQNETLQKELRRGKKLFFNTYSIPVNNQSIAGFVAKNILPVNITDVYHLNNTLPYAFDSQFDKLARYKTESMLTVPMTNQRRNLLGVMQLINAKDEQGKIIPFSSADEPLIAHFATTAALAVERAQLTRNMILRMISMAELRDPMETGAHVNRVGAYSVEIYEEWAKGRGFAGMDIERNKDFLRMAAMLHDVGKVAISDLILRKQDRLTDLEFEAMKSHTLLGARLFRDIQTDFEEVAIDVALNHHEKWDGTGYPGHVDISTGKPLPGCEVLPGHAKGKRGEEIPLFGRIVAVADVYDALSSRRSYKEAWDEMRIFQEMHALSGKSFDPEVIQAFFSCFDDLKAIGKRYPDRNQ